LFFLAPAAGHTTAENEKAFYEVLERFKSQKVDGVTLARVKTKTRADLIRRLDSNSGLAGLLTAYHAIYGDWRKLFTSLDELDAVTAEDVQRVAKDTSSQRSARWLTWCAEGRTMSRMAPSMMSARHGTHECVRHAAHLGAAALRTEPRFARGDPEHSGQLTGT
jgi:predicted Zn-dependent peptidase